MDATTPVLNYYHHQILIFNDYKISETKVRQEPEVPERRPKQWQSARKPECLIKTSAALAHQWHVPDVTPKADKEVMFCSLKLHYRL